MHFKNPVEKKPLAEQLLSCNDCNDTHTHKKRWLSGFGTSAILHVTHPLAITSANKLIQCAVGKRVGIVVRTRGEKGVGGVWKEGLED